MANNKKTGFAGATIGTVHPKGSKVVKTADGRIKVVAPKAGGKANGKRNK